MQFSEGLGRLLAADPGEWSAIVAELGSPYGIEMEADELAALAARLSGYASATGFGCDHSAALAEGDKRENRVWKAIGYLPFTG